MVHTTESGAEVKRWNGEPVTHAVVMRAPRCADSGDIGLFVSRAGSKRASRSNALNEGLASRTTTSTVNVCPSATATVSVAPATVKRAAWESPAVVNRATRQADATNRPRRAVIGRSPSPRPTCCAASARVR